MVFIVLRHERRRIVHFGVTAHPTAAWVAQQITEAFPWDSAPRYVIRDRDSVTGALVRARIKAMGIEDVVTAPRSPWRNPFVERVIGSIRRECLDHLIEPPPVCRRLQSKYGWSLWKKVTEQTGFQQKCAPALFG